MVQSVGCPKIQSTSNRLNNDSCVSGNPFERIGNLYALFKHYAKEDDGCRHQL